MKKKFRFLSVILTLAMCVGLCVPASASEYPSSSKTHDGITYKAILYADYETSFRGCTWVESNTNMSSREVFVSAMLYYNGIVRKQSKPARASGTLFIVNTDSLSSPGEYYSQGELDIDGDTVYTAETKHVTYSRTVSALLDTLDENGDYPVNSKGEAYGSLLLARVVGYTPDLVSAIGTNDVEGYLRVEDMTPDIRTPEAAAAYMETYYEDNVLPLYNSEGEVIGTFVQDLNPGISADSMEELQQKIASGLSTPLQETATLPQTEEELSALVAESTSKWAYPVNADGLTYGSPNEEEAAYKPDLIPVIATNGESGYMRRIDERKAKYNDSISAIPVYDLEGNTVGEFVFDVGITRSNAGTTRSSATTLAQARAARIEKIRAENM